MADARIEVEIAAKLEGLRKSLDEANRRIKDFGGNTDKSFKDVERGGASITTALYGMSRALAAAFSISAVVGFGRAVIKTTAEFEKLEAVLGNTLGSNAIAALKMAELSEFAAKTPFAVNELTAAFVKLANQGFVPSGKELTK